MASLRFVHEVIDAEPPGTELDITLPADLTGNGRPDIVIGGKFGEQNLFWYENPGWRRHFIAHSPELEAGGVIVDLNGDGRPDIVAGQQWGGNLLLWWECPPDPRQPWRQRVICDKFLKYHDQLVGDLDGDGRDELIFVSQRAGVLAWYRFPDDPTVEPWPDSLLHLIDDDARDLEGLALADLDGDGAPELIAGPRIYRRPADPTRPWPRETYAPDFTMTRVAVGDLDGDGRPEIVLAEGESHPARLAVCHAPDWTPEILRDDLFHPHSLALADFTGSGRLDIFTAEMGLGRHAEPRGFVFVNEGCQFREEIIWRGLATHEAKVADLDGDGRPDIVGKPYRPGCQIDIWWNRCGRAADGEETLGS